MCCTVVEGQLDVNVYVESEQGKILDMRWGTSEQEEQVRLAERSPTLLSLNKNFV